jgi:hypothetical protein
MSPGANAIVDVMLLSVGAIVGYIAVRLSGRR